MYFRNKKRLLCTKVSVYKNRVYKNSSKNETLHKEFCKAPIQTLNRCNKKESPTKISWALHTGVTGLEPAIFGLTGRRDNQLRYTPSV